MSESLKPVVGDVTNSIKSLWWQIKRMVAYQEIERTIAGNAKAHQEIRRVIAVTGIATAANNTYGIVKALKCQVRAT